MKPDKKDVVEIREAIKSKIEFSPRTRMDIAEPIAKVAAKKKATGRYYTAKEIDELIDFAISRTMIERTELRTQPLGPASLKENRYAIFRNALNYILDEAQIEPRDGTEIVLQVSWKSQGRQFQTISRHAIIVGKNVVW